MEASPANRLPEADSLPDGFVEIAADLSPPPPPDYKAAFVDLRPLEERLVDPFHPPSGSGSEAVSPGLLVNCSGKLVASTGLSAKRISVGDCPNSAGRYGISESSIPKNEVLLGTSTEGNSQRGSKSSVTETKDKMELHQTSLKESSETQRNTKSDKELLDFTLKYQKVVVERDAAISVHERLESLCRELQRQNKMLMDECQTISTEAQNMKQDLSTKFSDAIKDISNKLEVQKDDCLSQLNENEMLRKKLKILADQYALSEQHFGQKLQQKELELQFAELKLQQQEKKSVTEQTQIQLYAEQISQLMTAEKDLRLQLASDEERFLQFQDALSKSNEVFEAFKLEMEKMTKFIKELKKENDFLKGKCEKSDIAIVKLLAEHELMKKQLEKVKKQKEKLESLCRSLQAERKQQFGIQ